MLKSKFIFIFLLFTRSAYAMVAEPHFTFAYTNIDRFIELCLNAPECNLNQDQKDLLTLIAKTVPLERQNPKQLVFASESESPGLFLLNGQVKVAKTFDEIASNIYVNKDMIPKLQVIDAIAILVHELGHHHGIKDETQLDLLGLRVAFNYQQKYLQEAFNELIPEIRVSGYNYWLRASVGSVLKKNENFDLILSDNLVAENLSQAFLSFQCSENIPKITHCDDLPKIISSNVQNLAWQTSEVLQGNVTFICQCFDNSLLTAFSARKRFELSIKLNHDHYLKKSATIRILP
jgi:hypothetical protein